MILVFVLVVFIVFVVGAALMDLDVSTFKSARGAVTVRQADSKTVCSRLVVGHVQLVRTVVPVNLGSALDAPRIWSLLKICGDARALHPEGTFKPVVNVNYLAVRRAVCVFADLESGFKLEFRIVAGWPGDVPVAGGEIVARLATTATTTGGCSADCVTVQCHGPRKRKDA